MLLLVRQLREGRGGGTSIRLFNYLLDERQEEKGTRGLNFSETRES